MDILHTAEIIITLFVQSLGAWLANPLKLISTFGTEEFYLLLVPLLYWSVDSAVGMKVGLILLLNQLFNHTAKIGFHSPRPYWIDLRVIAYAPETTFGIPSNHAEISAAIWGLIAATYRKKWISASALLLVFLIGFSRVFLGVHFLSDVVTGWLIGVLTLLIFLSIEQPVTDWLKSLSLIQLYTLAALSSSGMILLALLVVSAVPQTVIQQAWINNSLAAFPEVPITPLSLDWIFTINGTWFGLLCGASWYAKKRGKFNNSGSEGQRLLRYLVGGLGVLVIWYGFGAVFPRSADIISYALRFLRYTLLGLWISAFAPLLFLRMGLYKTAEAAAAAD
jgi:membrane-associated phospholipid phosphatase